MEQKPPLIVGQLTEYLQQVSKVCARCGVGWERVKEMAQIALLMSIYSYTSKEKCPDKENRDEYRAEREFAMGVRVECELLWQGQDGWVAVSDAERPQERRQKGLRDARNSFWPWDKS